MITLDQYLMGRHLKWPKEYTQEIKENAIGLLVIVNDFIKTLDIRNVVVTSGFRPPSYNKTVKGAAKGSRHTTGQAIDLADPKKELAKLICGKDFKDGSLLEEFNLYAEHPGYTSANPKGSHWLHLQSVPPKSHTRIFIP